MIVLRPSGDRLHLHLNRIVLSTGLDGMIRGGEQGLFAHETRMLSEWRYLVDDAEPRAVGVAAVSARASHGYYVAFPPGRSRGEPDHGSGLLVEDTQHTLEIIVRRRLDRPSAGDADVIVEQIEINNYSDAPTAFRLHVQIDADFAGLPEVRHGSLGLGAVTNAWDAAGRSLRFDWRAERHFQHGGDAGVASDHRALTITVNSADGAAERTAAGLAFPVALVPLGRWTAELELRPFVASVPRRRARRERSLDAGTRLEFPGRLPYTGLVASVMSRARDDLASLRLEDLDHGTRAWTMAAGIPLYAALFGRDVLTASWQAGLMTADMMRGALLTIASLRGREDDPWRDEAPGRLLHEAHTGPLEVLEVNPRARYYGSVTTSGFFPVVLAEYWHWTGDDALVRDLVPTALDALRWLDEEGDLDSDGFVEYLTRSTDGVRHQAWKDSADAMVYPDGGDAAPPIATCEEQAFVYVAKLWLSEVLWRLGDRRQARALFRAARALRRRFNRAFWQPDAGILAMALDADKRPIASVASNPGHCLAAGIVRREHVKAVADRLFEDDMFSGWGVRTLSSAHPAYNPYSYHRGSVWPVEQGSFALGLMRYGLHDHLHRLAKAVFDAAALFEHHRLPELFAGHPRDERHPFPGLYPQANAPQAWSASTLFLIIQSLLGLYPYAPSKLLFLDPQLPPWLPAMTVKGLCVGDATISMTFRRTADGKTRYRVIEKRGELHVVRQASPWSLTEPFSRRVRTLARSALAGVLQNAEA